MLANARAHGHRSPELTDVVDWIRIIQLGLLANKNSFNAPDNVLERQLRTLLVPAVVVPVATPPN